MSWCTLWCDSPYNKYIYFYVYLKYKINIVWQYTCMKGFWHKSPMMNFRWLFGFFSRVLPNSSKKGVARVSCMNCCKPPYSKKWGLSKENRKNPKYVDHAILRSKGKSGWGFCKVLGAHFHGYGKQEADRSFPPSSLSPSLNAEPCQLYIIFILFLYTPATAEKRLVL